MVKLSEEVIRAHIAQNKPATVAPATVATNKLPARQRKRLIETEFYNTVLDTMLMEMTSPGDERQESTLQGSGNSPIADVDYSFCCPITKKPLQDPVVAPDGISYERRAVPVCEKQLYYPNRILKSIITESKGQQPLSITTNLLQKALVNDDVDERESHIADAIEKLLQEMSSLPEAYHCPITFRPMRDPVIDPEGNTFERKALVSWLEENGTSPITRNPVNVDDLYPNTSVSLSNSLKQLKESLQLWNDTNRERDVELVKEIVSLCGVTQQGDSIQNSRIAGAEVDAHSSSSSYFSNSYSTTENFFVATFPDDITEFRSEIEGQSSPNSVAGSAGSTPTQLPSDVSSASYDSTYFSTGSASYYSTGTDDLSINSSSSSSHSSSTSSLNVTPRDDTGESPFSTELSQTSGISISTSFDDIQSRSSVSSMASSSPSSSSPEELSSAPLRSPRLRPRSQRQKRWWRKLTTRRIRTKFRRARFRVRNTVQRITENISSISQHDIYHLVKRQCKFLLSLVIGFLILAVSPVIAIVALLLLLLSGCS